MESEIKAILRGLPGVKVKAVGSLWSISIGGSLSGARKDGKALAMDLRKQWEHIRDRERYGAEPVLVAIPEFLQDPEPPPPDPRIELQAARIAELEAQLAKSAAQANDAFNTAELQDLLREDEPHASAQRRWLTDYTQLTNRMVDIRLPALSDAERAYQRRLQAALYSGRRGAVETI